MFSNRLTLSAEAWRSEVKVFGEPSRCLKDQFSSLMRREQGAEDDTPATVSAGDGNSTQLAPSVTFSLVATAEWRALTSSTPLI